jgi:hypothetical protein
MHIPPEKLLPQDKVLLYDHGPADEPFKKPVETLIHSTDAKEAIDRDPTRYSLDRRSFKAPELVVDNVPRRNRGPIGGLDGE